MLVKPRENDYLLQSYNHLYNYHFFHRDAIITFLASAPSLYVMIHAGMSFFIYSTPTSSSYASSEKPRSRKICLSLDRALLESEATNSFLFIYVESASKLDAYGRLLVLIWKWGRETPPGSLKVQWKSRWESRSWKQKTNQCRTLR